MNERVKDDIKRLFNGLKVYADNANISVEETESMVERLIEVLSELNLTFDQAHAVLNLTSGALDVKKQTLKV